MGGPLRRAALGGLVRDMVVRDMAIKKSDGRPASYHGETHPGFHPAEKYPDIEPGARGIVVPRHPWGIEKEPERPLAFYPAKWGYIYFFSVGEGAIEYLEVT